MIRLLAPWLLLVGACAEPADPTPLPRDATIVDATPRPVGAACVDSADCAGVCLPGADGRGERCVAACDGGCPAGTACMTVAGVDGCLPVAAEAGVGEPCGIDTPCVEGARCAADVDPERTVCATICADDPDCGAGEACTVTGVCAPADAPARACPFVECARGDLICVDQRCVATCADLDTPCVDGGTCSRRAEDGAFLCLPTASGALGTRCVSGGAAACADDLQCFSRAPGDPAAICARPCADDCPEDFVCRRPAGFTERICMPAPLGIGDGAADLFESCAAHGPSDCLPHLDCVIGPAGAPICAAPCADGCGEDAVCDDAGLTPHCRRRTRERIGLACDGDGDCPAGRCVPAPVPYCTAACAPQCPPGFYCAGDECLIGDADERPLGAACDDGAATCASGLCAADPATGAALCTRDCSATPCPDAFRCEAVEASRLCFPAQ